MSLFITGCSGFLGLGLLYFLDDMNYKNNIYLLIREKYKTAKERFDDLKQNFPKLKLFLVEHNILELYKLQLKVDIVINCVASVKFDLDLKDAVEQNVDTVIHLLKYVKNNNIQKVIHISTAYVSQPGKFIKEKFVNLKLLGNTQIYKKIKNDEITFEEIITKQWFPNTYCFTKCLAEKIIQKEMKHSKAVFSIIRPSIITNAIEKPYLGWFKGYNGGIGVHKLIKSNLLNHLICNENTRVNYVPVDYVCSIVVGSFTNTKNSIKHATSFFDLLTIKEFITLSDENIKCYRHETFYTKYLKYYNILFIIISIIYNYLMSFFRVKYAKIFEKQLKILDIVLHVQDTFHHFFHTSYYFHNSSNYKTSVSRDEYYKSLFKSI
jgi:nucleoside-diphosphate-sugar epimerase